MSAQTRSQTPIADALDQMGAEEVLWVRLAAVRRDDCGFSGCLLELVGGAPPPDWEPTSWEYPDAIFMAFHWPGSRMADCLREGSIEVDGHTVQLPELQSVVQWQRHQSRHVGTYQPLEWPAVEAQLVSGGPQYEPQGHLLAAGDAPSFLNLYTAAANFFSMGTQIAGGAMNQAVIYRHQDRGARITHIRVANDQVEVGIEGTAVDGLTVELPGDSPGPSRQIWADPIEPVQVVHFELKDRLPSGSWLVLRKGPKWFDRRFLTVPWSRDPQSGVEYVVETATRLESLVATRERDQLEFKRQIPGEMEGKGRLMKTVCAFANGQGGSVLLGVDDDRNIVGVGSNEIGRVSDQLTEMVGTWLEPRPRIEFFDLPIDDGSKVVLELWVHALANDVCASGRPGETKLIYVRHHGVTEKATVGEIKSLLAARPEAAPFSFNAFG